MAHDEYYSESDESYFDYLMEHETDYLGNDDVDPFAFGGDTTIIDNDPPIAPAPSEPVKASEPRGLATLISLEPLAEKFANNDFEIINQLLCKATKHCSDLEMIRAIANGLEPYVQCKGGLWEIAEKGIWTPCSISQFKNILNELLTESFLFISKQGLDMDKRSQRWLVNWINDIETYTKNKRLDNLIKSLEPLLRAKEIRSNTIAFANGTFAFEIENGKVVANRVSTVCAFRLPCNYDYENGLQWENSEWDQYLRLIFPHADSRELLQVSIGSNLTAKQISKIAILLYGNGNNGKSTFFRAIDYALGRMVKVSTKALALDSNQFAQNELAYKQFIYFEEFEPKELNFNLFKELTGGNNLCPIRYELKGKEAIAIPSQCNVMLFATNNIPFFRNEKAIINRLIIIDMPISFVENPELDNEYPLDPELSKRLSKDKQSILNWIMQGYFKALLTAQFNEEGEIEELLLPVSPRLKEVSKQFLTKDDYLSLYLSERTVPKKGSYLIAKDMLGNYKEWLSDNEIYTSAPSLLKFREEVQKRLPTIKEEYSRQSNGSRVFRFTGIDWYGL